MPRAWLTSLAMCVAIATSAHAQGAAPSAVETLYEKLAALPRVERQKALEEGAKKEGALALVHTLRGELGANHIAIFSKRYPFLKIDANVDIGSQDAAERLVAEETTGRHLTDLITIAHPDLTEPERLNFVARYPTPAVEAILPRFREMENPRQHSVIFYWSEHGISYNTQLVPPERAPKDWFDLCDPYFKGNVSFDPLETRFLAGLRAIMGMSDVEKFLTCMGANDPIIQRGHGQRVELMLAGDHMAQGDNYLYYGWMLQKKNPSLPNGMALGARMMANTGVSVINRNAAHPYAAALFTDWTLSDESQKYLAGEGRGPVTMPHPFIPDDAKIYNSVDPPKEDAERLIELWRVHMEKRGR